MLKKSAECRSDSASPPLPIQYRPTSPDHPIADYHHAADGTACFQAQAPDPKLSRLQKPAGMSLEEWQTELRRQFGREQKFRLRNLGDHPALSDFQVTNPQSRNTYRVTIRGLALGDNSCTCPGLRDQHARHLQAHRIHARQVDAQERGEAALKNGHWPPTSEVHLQYGAQRHIRFRPGDECPAALAKLAMKYFGDDRLLLPGAAEKFDDFLTRLARSIPI